MTFLIFIVGLCEAIFWVATMAFVWIAVIGLFFKPIGDKYVVIYNRIRHWKKR